MGLAGDQQHAQAIADTLDDQQRLVVGKGHLVVARCHLDLQQVLAGMTDRHLNCLFGVDGNFEILFLAIGQANRHRCRCSAGWLVLDTEGHGLVIAGDGKARRIGDDDAAICFRL